MQSPKTKDNMEGFQVQKKKIRRYTVRNKYQQLHLTQGKNVSEEVVTENKGKGT